MLDDATARAGFSGLGDRIYLNSASMGVGCDEAGAALREAAVAWVQGRFDYTASEAAGEACRAMFARLIGAAPQDIAIIPTASAVAGQIAAHVLRTRSAGTILVGAEEYTSNLFPWRMLEQAGFDVRLIAHRDGGVHAPDVAAAADGRTRLIAVSAVQSATGFRADLAALRRIADASDALLYVDAAQMAGVLAIEADRYRIDALAAPAQKFLLGTRGMGYAYLAPWLREAMLPVAPGWKAALAPMASFYGPAMELSPTASRFDQSLAWFNVLADVQSLGLLDQLGFASVFARNEMLAAHLRGALRSACVPFLDHPPEHASAIVSVEPRDSSAVERLRAVGVAFSVRGGRVRLSVHLYNTKEQLDRVVAMF